MQDNHIDLGLSDSVKLGCYGLNGVVTAEPSLAYGTLICME